MWSTSLQAAVLLMVLNYCFSSPTKPSSDPHKFCAHLKNAHYNEYLFASPGNAADPKSNQVFTWARKDNPVASEWAQTRGSRYQYQGLWQFVAWEPGKFRDNYLIKSAYYKNSAQILYSTSSLNIGAKNKDLRSLVNTYRGTDFPVKNNIWELTPVSGFKDRFRIHIKNFLDNLADKEYLHADQDLDQNSRKVFTKFSTKISDVSKWEGKGDWILESVDCPSYLI